MRQIFYKKNDYDLLQHLVYLEVPAQLKFQQDQLARWATEWHYNQGRPPPCTLCPPQPAYPPLLQKNLDPKFIWANFCQLTKFFITKSFFYQIILGFSDFVGPQSLCAFDFLGPTYIMEPGFRRVYFNPKYLLFGDLKENLSVALLSPAWQVNIDYRFDRKFQV